MGFLSRLFGGGDEQERDRASSRERVSTGRAGAASDDERAVERYRYLLKTAPPETIEQAHADAFAQLTPEQRQMVLQELTAALPERERIAAQDDDPRALARTATRAEMRQPGTLERTFGGFSAPGMGMGGVGLGGLMAGSFLSSFAGVLVAGAIANQFFDESGSDGTEGDGGDAGTDGEQTDASADSSGDPGAGDAGSGDFGDGGGFDSGFGGGDFGGGDFGGGDFGGEF
ncbi:MAG: hypothetical protein M3Q10_18580 [Chloroflexota bacterium]|nr:hypothetical protein [Chloroflexota bacterium]